MISGVGAGGQLCNHWIMYSKLLVMTVRVCMFIPPTRTPSAEVYHRHDPAPCPSLPLQEAVCAERGVREREGGGKGWGGMLPVETMLLISQWVLTQMDALKKRATFMIPFWIIPFMAFPEDDHVALLFSCWCSVIWDTVCSYSRSPQRAKSKVSVAVNIGMQRKEESSGMKYLRACCLMLRKSPPSGFMAKPIVLNLTLGWCNARRDVRADAAVTKLLARYVLHSARKVQEASSPSPELRTAWAQIPTFPEMKNS